MTVKELYKYKREDGGTDVSPIKPDCEYELMYRLIADEGKILVKGDIETFCIDVEDITGWNEKDYEDEVI